MNKPGLTKTGFARLLAFVLVACAAAYTAYDINARNIDRVDRSELVACARVQILRDQANGTNFLIYDTFKQVVVQQRAVIKSGHLTGPALKQVNDSIKRSERVVKTTVVTGPTNCDLAVHRPAQYIPPAPEFIDKNSPRIAIARKRAEAIVNKARLGIPLYPAGSIKP